MIRIHDKTFKPFLSEAILQKRIKEMSQEIDLHYVGLPPPLFIAILNGSFIFAADLMRACTMACEISFVKLQSYEGTDSTGTVQTMIGLAADVVGRDLIIVEDIVDTGRTLSVFLAQIRTQNPKSVTVATLLLKPDALTVPFKPDFCGFVIPNKFVVGYGLDYDGLGRNIPEIYQLSDV
jgi:hypoxanthine phosphoribosyltransferase